MANTVNIGGIDIRMRASARVPFLYRRFFMRDIFGDIDTMLAEVSAKAVTDASCATSERLAWIFAINADDDAMRVALASDEDDFAAWLDGFPSVVAFLQAMPDIISIWIDSMAAHVEPKKNSAAQ